jgi:hypothetical protein
MHEVLPQLGRMTKTKETAVYTCNRKKKKKKKKKKKSLVSPDYKIK